jgi:hypothetical protein
VADTMGRLWGWEQTQGCANASGYCSCAYRNSDGSAVYATQPSTSNGPTSQQPASSSPATSTQQPATPAQQPSQSSEPYAPSNFDKGQFIENGQV